MKPLISLCAILLLFSSCNISNNKSESMEDYAAFDWFEYNGYDPLYEGLEPGPDEYLNPILSGFYPDPSIVRVEEDYYLVNSTFSFYPGIPVFHSKDLVNWNQIGHVLDRPSQLVLDSLDISQGVFAPAISYNNGLFYVVNTIVYGIGNFVVTATNPAGPWSDPQTLPIDGIDPSLFFDDNGKAYLVNNGSPDREPLYEGHRAIWIQEFDKDRLTLIGPRKVIIDGGVDINQKPIWIEGPHLFKTNGYYYLCAAEGGTSVDHSQVIFRSKNVWGPYKPWDNNPILTQRHLDPDRPQPVTCTGHADMVETQNGEWWAVFLGCTPYADDYYNTGRQTFLLPVSWKDDWPIILSGNDLVPYLNFRPDLPAQDLPKVPLNGNFSIRDEFADTTLAMIWNFIRTPYNKWYELKKDKLLIKARNVAINDIGQPSFIGRRQQHHYCSAITSMQFNPKMNGDMAGLAVFQNEEHYYLLVLTKKADGKFIVLERGSSEGPLEIASSAINLSENHTLQFKIEARGKFYDFYYAVQPEQWTLLEKDIDATWLSTNVAEGFVGAYFGMYAYSSGEQE
jgi:xylan 1,4-beta-xylosidase